MAAINKRLRIATDEAADWLAWGGILAKGQLGYESDSGKLKIGDGVTAWSSLGYFNSGGGGGAVDSVNGQTGVVVLDTDNISEGVSNLYYTQGRFDASFAGKTTTDLSEGSNLYYTQSRFDNAFAAKTTTSLTEGSNLYYTQGRFDASLATKTTTNLTEGSNLYFTQGRFDTSLATKTTTDLAEGSNLYYTQARFNTAFAAKTTTDLAEGTNLYFTNARVLASVITGFTATNSAILATDTVLQAFGKAQGQMNQRPTGVSGTAGRMVKYTAAGTIANSVVFLETDSTADYVTLIHAANLNNATSIRGSGGLVRMDMGNNSSHQFVVTTDNHAYSTSYFFLDQNEINFSGGTGAANQGVLILKDDEINIDVTSGSGSSDANLYFTPTTGRINSLAGDLVITAGTIIDINATNTVINSGNFGVGYTPASNIKAGFQGGVSSNSTFSLVARNSTSDIFSVRDDKKITFGTGSFFANTAFTFDANAVSFGSYISNYTGAGVLSVGTTTSSNGFYTTQSGKFGIGYSAEMTGEDQKGISLILSGSGTDGSGLYIENNTGSYDSITVTNGGRRFRINENSFIVYEDGAQAADAILISDIDGVGRWGSLASIAGAYVPYTGATTAVALGNNSLTARSVVIGGSNNTINMGTTAGVSSTISSTTNATKGTITIGAIASIDEANLRFRIGTATTADTNADSLFATSATTKKGLVLQGKSSQTANLLEVQSSTGAVLGSWSAVGNLAIGSATSATDALLINKTFSADTGLFNNAIGVNVTNNQTSGIAILTALNLTATQSSGVATLPICTTLVMGAVAASAGTFLNGFFVGAQFGMSSTVAQTGGIADAYIFNLVSPTYTGSAPAINFGINIQNQGHSGVTSSAAIFINAQSGSTNNYGILSNANILVSHPTSGLGYTGGAGGAVTQATSKSTGVTLNTVTGQITMNNATLNAGTSVAFTLTNSNITANDAVWVTFKSGNTANSYTVQTDSTGTGSCTISLRNYTGGNLGEAVVLNFVIIKGASA